MKGQPEIIDALNGALTIELTVCSGVFQDSRIMFYGPSIRTVGLVYTYQNALTPSKAISNQFILSMWVRRWLVN